ARKKRLPRSRRAHEEDALRDAPAELLELLRLLQELDDLLQLFLRFVDARHVLERDLLLRARRQLRLALAERQRLVAAALHLAHEENPEADHQENRRPRIEQRGPGTGGRLLRADGDAALEQLVREAIVLGRRVGRKLLALFRVSGDVLAGDRDGGNLSVVDLAHEIGERPLLIVLLQLGREIPDEHTNDDEHHPEQHVLQRGVQAGPPTGLSLKISTACAGSVTRNWSSIVWPATQTILSRASTTIGTTSR